MQIRIRHLDGRDECIELDARQTLRLGTRSSADVQLSGLDVHSLHLGILLRDDAFTAVAFKKVGKIRVNGKMVRKRVLQEGDRIEVGDNLIEVLGTQDGGDRDGVPREKRKKVRKRRSSRRRKEVSNTGAPSELLDELSRLDESSDLLGEPADDLLSVDEQELVADSLVVGSLSQDAPTEPTVHAAVAAAPSTWWDSAWFKACVIALVILPLAVLIAIHVWQLPDAKQRFQIADQLYQQGDYANAAEAYEIYLAQRGEDTRADEALVKRHLAMLLEDLDRGVDAEAILKRVRQSIINWGASRRCAYAQAGLAELLPALVADFTRQGRVYIRQDADESARESLQQAGEALNLVYHYLPPRLQASCGVPQLQLYFTRLERELEEPAALRAALDRIEEDVTSGGIKDAYTVRGELLSTYPKLVTDGRLLASMRAVGRAEAARVEPARNESGTTDPPPARPAWRQIILRNPLADATGGPRRTVAVAVALAEFGAVYGVDTASNRVLWRKSVGGGATLTPIRIGQDGFVLVDQLHGDLLAVAATSGAVRWRLPLDSLAGPPVVDQGRMIAATTDGTMRAIDVIQGTPTGGLLLPQKLCVGPTIDPVAPRCYQIAEHSMIYVLAIDQSKCLSSYYLGHEQGCVSLAPVVLGEFLLVFEQIGPAQSVVHLLRRGDQLKPIQAVAVPATPVDAPVVIGDMVYLPGSDGQVHLLRYNPSDNRRPLQVETAFDPGRSGSRGNTPFHLAAVAGRLWVAGDGVAVYRPAAAGVPPLLLRRQWTDLGVTGLVRTTGDGVLVVGKNRDGGPYLVCGGNDGESGVGHRVTLAAAPAAPPLLGPDGDEFWVPRLDGILCRGTVNELANAHSSASARKIRESLLATALPTPLLTTALWCGPWGFVGPLPGAGSLAIVSRGETQPARILLTPPQRLACPPVAVGSHLVLAARHGPITLYDTRRQRFAAGEFLPDITGRLLPNWRTPAVLTDRQFVVSDGRSRLFLLQIGPDGDAVLQVAESDESVEFTSPLVAVGTTVWGVSASGELCRVLIPRLAVVRDAMLRGTVQWGPAIVGSRGFLCTDQGEFYCLGNAPGGDWSMRLDIGPVVGACKLDEGHMAVASANGRIVVIDINAGSLATAPMNARQRIACGPLLLGRRLAVLTPDSCLLVMEKRVDELLDNRARTDPSSHRGAEE